jgi:predicted RNA methylase
MQVGQDILQILERSALEGPLLRLPDGQLDRSTYAAVNKVIEAAGGKWNRKAKAHVFDGDAIETIEPILLTGEYTRTKQDFGQFDTPPGVVARVIELARITPGMSFLEPNAGIGNIVGGAEAAGAQVTAFEIDAKRLHTAKERHELHGGIFLSDFLRRSPLPVFDRVGMNPPFAKQADIDHVSHAAKFLKPGGRLVAVMSAGVTFRTDTKTVMFWDFLASRNATREVLPIGAFKESGTMVNAIIVSFDV